MMQTHTHLCWISRTLVIWFLLIRCAIAHPSFVNNPHSGYTSEDLKHALERLPEEQHELIKRQLDALLGGVLREPGDTADPLGPGLGRILDGSGLLSGGLLSGLDDLGDITWPLDVWDRFRFIPPGPDDKRGVCVGLNAMANHGLIARSGIVDLFETLRAAQVMGMGFDTALLTVLPAFLFAGDPVTLTMSIGGVDNRVALPLGGLGGLLGEPQGLDYTNGLIEQDSSSTRRDVYDTGDPATLDIDLFIELSSLVPPGGRFDLSVYGYWAAHRFHESIHTSPNFWYGPAAGILFRTGVYALVPRLLANQSGAYSDGELTHEVLESFYAITHWPTPFTYNFGCERIPENWYGLRSVGSSWPALQVVNDVFAWCGPYPELCSFGGNVNGVDTFAGVRLDDPAFGLANLGLLADGSNFLCFALHMVKMASPTWTNNLFATLFETLGTTVASVGCPEIPDLTRGGVPFLDSLKQQYPGARWAL